MAQVISADQQVINFAKYWYTDKKFENLLVRNDPFAEMITKTRIGGQAYRFAAMYGRGGNVSGSAAIAVAIANNNPQSRNAEWIVPPGRIFSVFNITNLELMSTQTSKGAYIKALENKFFAGTEALRKTFAKAIYGYGYGEQALMGGLNGFGLANTVNTVAPASSAYSTVSTGIALGSGGSAISAGVGVPTGTGPGPYAGFTQLGTATISNGIPTVTTNTGISVTATNGIVTFSSGSFNTFVYQFEKYSDIIGIDIGSIVQFTNPSTSGSPADGFNTVNSTTTNGSFYWSVAAINGTQVTFCSVNSGSSTPYALTTGNLAAVATTLFSIQAGSWMILVGASDSNGPNFPFGLSVWVPWLANRGSSTGMATNTGAITYSTAWSTYIGTAFCGLTRSVAADRLAGSYFFNQSAVNLSDAVLEATRLVRRNGARNKDIVILMNDVDLKNIMNELGGVSTNKTTYFQETNGMKKQTVQKGLSDINFQFMTTWLDRVLDSPYIQQGICWVLDESTTEFVAISNVERITNDGVAINEPGVPDATQMGGGPELTSRLVIEDFLTVQPATTLSEGPGAQVIISLFGNLAIHNPAHCVCVRLY
jgi:hypothetical protein